MDIDGIQIPKPAAKRWLLLLTIFVVGGCGLFYELVTGAVASYLVGDSVVQYSLVIGTFLAAMGLGAFVTQWARTQLLDLFLLIQVIVGLVGGFSSLVLFWAFSVVDNLTPVVVAITAVCGLLVGTEIPLMLRILKADTTLRVNVAQVFTLDYLGALVASICFPFFVLPQLGLVRSAIFIGLFNVLVSATGLLLFWSSLKRRGTLLTANILGAAALVTAMLTASSLTHWLEDKMYQDEIVHAADSQYQRIVLTRWRSDYRLYLNGHLQFSSADEYRYHESLVLPALAATDPKRVLLLGGGDGLAAKTILKNPLVETVDLVDIDPAVTDLFRNHQALRELNDDSLRDLRVKVHHADAMAFLRQTGQTYDAIVMDLPDPSNPQLNKLYSRTFFSLALRRLSESGVIVTQATSPFYARNSFWCIAHTLADAEKEIRKRRGADRLDRGVEILPYHVHVPSFGDWGFVMLSRGNDESAIARRIGSEVQFLTGQQFLSARQFPPDCAEIPTKINRLDAPVLVQYHQGDWKRWSE